MDLHINGISTLGYVGGNLGASYGYSLNAHLSLNAGMEYSQLGSSTKPLNFIKELVILDSEEDMLTMRYVFNRYRERQRAHYLNFIPLNVEYADGRLYCAAGVKVGLNMGATSVTMADMETTGEYPEYIGTYKDMPDHYFTQQNVQTTNSIDFKVNVMASAEVGINIARDVQKSDPVRLALFCDYGLSNIAKKSGALPSSSNSAVEQNPNLVVIASEEHPEIVSFNSLTTTMSNHVTSLMVGLKLVIFFESPSTKKVYPCFCQ